MCGRIAELWVLVLQVLKHSARAGYCGIFLFSMVLAWFARDFAGPLVDKIPGMLT